MNSRNTLYKNNRRNQKLQLSFDPSNYLHSSNGNVLCSQALIVKEHEYQAWHYRVSTNKSTQQKKAAEEEQKGKKQNPFLNENNLESYYLILYHIVSS